MTAGLLERHGTLIEACSPSIDYTQTLADHRVLASAGSAGDVHDNALAESFVDSFKAELIADRAWRSRSQLELAVVEYIGSNNGARLGHIPPPEYEAPVPAERGRVRSNEQVAVSIDNRNGG